MSENTLPLRQHEATQIQFLLGLISECTRSQDVLKRRLRATGDDERYGQLCAEIGDITDRVLATVDADKLLTLRKNLKHQELRIVTKAPADASQYGWTLVPARALQSLFATAAKWECKTCDGSPCEMTKCSYRKTLKQLMMFDLEDDAGGCFARRLEWEE